jgi:hypothetical protein
MAQRAGRNVRPLQQDDDTRIPRAQNAAAAPRPQPGHGPHQGALADPGFTPNENVLPPRDHDLGCVEHHVAARLRNRQAFDVNGVVRTVSKGDAAVRNGLDRHIEIVTGRGELDHAPRGRQPLGNAHSVVGEPVE